MTTQQTDRTYNGWTNYETWVVALWLDNEESSYTYWRERASERREGIGDDATAVHGLADELKDDFEAGRNELLEDAKKTASVWADLLNAALSEVDWREIARHLIEE